MSLLITISAPTASNKSPFSSFPPFNTEPRHQKNSVVFTQALPHTKHKHLYVQGDGVMSDGNPFETPSMFHLSSETGPSCYLATWYLKVKWSDSCLTRKTASHWWPSNLRIFNSDFCGSRSSFGRCWELLIWAPSLFFCHEVHVFLSKICPCPSGTGGIILFFSSDPFGCSVPIHPHTHTIGKIFPLLHLFSNFFFSKIKKLTDLLIWAAVPLRIIGLVKINFEGNLSDSQENVLFSQWLQITCISVNYCKHVTNLVAKYSLHARRIQIPAMGSRPKRPKKSQNQEWETFREEHLSMKSFSAKLIAWSA